MKRFLILSDGYNSTIVSETNERYNLGNFVRMLCEPHKEEYDVREVNMEEAWEEDPAVPDEAYEFARMMDIGHSLTEYQFNTVYHFAEEVH